MKPYPNYQEIGIEWLDKIPSHWEMEKLKYLAKVNNSNVDKKTIDVELPVRLCNYTDVYYNSYIHPGLSLMNATATEEELNKFRLHEGDVLITKDSESWDDIAIPAYVKESSDEMVCGYHLAHIHPNTEKLTGKYLFFSFMSDDIRIQFETSATGITRYGIPKYAIDNGLFVIPPLPEQKQIAKYLDHKTAKIDSLIEKKKRLIELLKEERTAVINQVVTKGLDPNMPMKDSGIEWLGEMPEHWEVKKLKYLAKINNSNVDKKTHDGEMPVRLCNYTDVYYNDYIHPELDLMTATATEEEINKFRLKRGDVLITKDSESWDDIAIPAYVKESSDEMVCGYHLAHIRPVETKLKGEYLFYAFMSEDLCDQFEISATGVTRYGLPKFAIDNSQFAIPSVSEQEQITKYLGEETNRIDSIISKSENEIELLQEYRTALISEVVTGKIDVREEKI